jgi:FkbM family methyltransferase
MRIFRLALTALATVLLLTGYIYLFDPLRWQFTVACFTRAPSIAACVREDFDFTTDFFGMRLEGNMANLIDRNIFYYGAFEKPHLFLLRDLMKAAGGEAGIFIDIGANTGQHSLFMSRYAKTVHAFEPWEPVLKKFRHALEINGVKNVVIHPYGIGEESSKKPFFQPGEKNLGTGSFVEGFHRENKPAGELAIEKGDDAFAKENISAVTLIKMDIEGYEGPALAGIKNTLIKQRPIILFELSIDANRPVTIKSIEKLRALFPENYELLVVSEKSDLATGDYILESIDGIVRFDKVDQYDLLAFPGERKHLISLRGPTR